MSKEKEDILITGFMELSTSYLREEIAQLSGLSLADVIEQLQKGVDQGIIESTKIGDHQFWSKKDKPDPK